MAELVQFQFVSTHILGKFCQHRKEESRMMMLKESTGSRGVLRVMAADGWGRFFWRGPLHSGVLQQLMQTELSFPVQNCW